MPEVIIYIDRRQLSLQKDVYTVLYIGVRNAYLANPLRTVPSSPSRTRNVCIIFSDRISSYFFSHLAEETTTSAPIIIGSDFPATSFKYPWEH